MRQGKWLLVVFVAGLLIGWGVTRLPMEGRAEAQQGGVQVVGRARWEYKFVNWKVSRDATKDAKNEEEALTIVTAVLNKKATRRNQQRQLGSIPAAPFPLVRAAAYRLFKRPKQ